MDLNELQSRLEHLYDVRTPHRVKDFLLHDPQFARIFIDDTSAQSCPERLLVAQAEDAVDVSLFLHQEVVERLVSDNPVDRLHAGNLQDFWFALEGVSHFLYLAWRAGIEVPLTLLELELQAEVDKFVATAALIYQQHGHVAGRSLWHTLFKRIRFRDSIDAEQRRRYQEANRLAARYCERLTRSYALAPAQPALMRELRRFYRMPQLEKIRYIESTAAV